MILAEVFVNRIFAQNTYFTNQKSGQNTRLWALNLQISTKLFDNHSYPKFPSSSTLFFIEPNIANCKDDTAIQRFIYYWIYSGARKVFRKKKFPKENPFKELL